MADTPTVYEASRLDKLRAIEQLGIDPWGQRFDGHQPIEAIRALNPEATPLLRVRAAGRIVSRRLGGKVHFLDIVDWSGRPVARQTKSQQTDKHEAAEFVDWSSRIQVMAGQKQVGALGWSLAQNLDLGDLLGVEGTFGKTRTGELTIFADSLYFLGKSLESHPDKWGGMEDIEYRLRHRYLDLIYNPETFDRAMKRIKVVRRIRSFLDGQGFVEVETPTLHAIAGGAAARPFVTHHNALDIDLYLRIALELHLKRLLVGGVERVYEIGRVFRNEGIDARHNPEFTMLELYQAYGDYKSMMDLTEAMVKACVAELYPDGRKHLTYGPSTVDFARWQRRTYGELFAEHVGVAMDDAAGVRRAARPGDLERLAGQVKLTVEQLHPDVIVHHLFEERVEPHLAGPIFVYDYPATLCPLTKRKRDNPALAERFELYVQSMELANAYTELNDPLTQEATFRQQLAGLPEEESMAKMDEDFVCALRHGMPPAGGLGVGIDRLVMLLTDTQTIRDVILFPLLRPEKG
ncbi:MAG: lysine--tRNA ligase [Gemmataceae bacterium]|nr:lysine--tRNA ligase [Gemmataceae bacterium]